MLPLVLNTAANVGSCTEHPNGAWPQPSSEHVPPDTTEKAPFEAGKRVLTAAAHSSWDTDSPTSQALEPDGAKCKKMSLLPENSRKTM